MRRWMVYGSIAAAGVWLLSRRGVRPPTGRIDWSNRAGLRTLIANLLNTLPDPPNREESRVMYYFPEVERAAARHRVEPALIASIIAVESGGLPEVRGLVGEYGLMQIREATAQMMGYSGAPDALLDPALNTDYGSKYLRWQFDRYADQMLKHEWAVAAYHAGTAYRRNGEFVNSKGDSVQGYVDKVIKVRLPELRAFFTAIYKLYGRPPRGALEGLRLFSSLRRCGACQ